VSRRPAKVTQPDIARTIRAIEQTGVRRIVEIASDGTIRIVPVERSFAAAKPKDDQLEEEREIVL
jgi:hypothetical protein